MTKSRLEDDSMLTEEQYNTLLSSDVKHYKVLFEIAKYESRHNKIKQAKIHIDEALLNIENSRLADANDSLEVFWIIGNKKIKKSHVFQMAGFFVFFGFAYKGGRIL